VYALWGLLEAKRAGVAVDEAAVARGLAAMRAWTGTAVNAGGGETATVAMAAYVLAEMGQPDASLNARLFGVRRSMPVYGRAFLLAAMARGKAPPADVVTLTGELEGLAQGGKVTETASDTMRLVELDTYLSSDVRSTAITLKALVEVDPQNPIVAQLAQGLIDAQQPNGAWLTTQENLYGLAALADVARNRRAQAVHVKARLGKPLFDKRLGKSGLVVFKQTLNKLEPGTLTVDVDGAAWVSVRLEHARRDGGKEPIANGFSLTREYRDAGTGELLTAVRPGQLVRVVLHAASDDERHRVALVDPLPAGLEPVLPPHDDLDDHNAFYDRDRWVHSEAHDDRVLAFSDFLSGTMDFEYTARAGLSGSFTAAPATIEEMYRPEVRARTTPARLDVHR
jgi:uncharacterized protein YfaS (alpha-2-macroglobulin family)